MKTTAKTKRPKPPEELDGEALLEWHRVADELDDAGRLDATDRAMLALYARTHGKYAEAMRSVEQHGMVIQYGGNPALSPFYKASEKLAAQLRGLLNDLGLSPVARAKANAGKPAEPAPLDFD